MKSEELIELLKKYEGYEVKFRTEPKYSINDLYKEVDYIVVDERVPNTIILCKEWF